MDHLCYKFIPERLFCTFRDLISTVILFFRPTSNTYRRVDARSVTTLSAASLDSWFRDTRHTVHYGSWEPYTVFTLGHLPNQDVTPISQLHTIRIDGYFISADRDNLTNLIHGVLDSIGTGMTLSTSYVETSHYFLDV